MLQDIREIIYGFASENRIYSNEAQFQHDLAISLEKLGYDVYLEVLSINANSLDELKTKKKNNFTLVQFLLHNGRTIQGNLNWREKGKEVDIIGCDKKRAGRENPLSLSGSYTCTWEDYDIGCKVKKPLKFMIFEIENKD